MKGLIFTLVLTYGGAVVSLFRPWYGLLVYVCFACLRPDFLWSYSVPHGNYSRIIGIALLVGWTLDGFGNWQFGKAKPIVYALLGYWGWQVVSAFFAAVPAVAWAQVEMQSKILLPVLIGMTLIKEIKQLHQLAWVLVLSLGYVAYEANLSYFTGFNWIRESGFGSMDNNSISIAMVAGASVAFFLGLNETIWWRKWPAFVIAAVLAHTPLIADSRGGMVGLMVSGVVAFLIIPKSPRHLAFFLLALAVGVRMAGPPVRERFSTIFADRENRDASAQSRLDLWQDTWDTMKKNPLFGVGPDHWPITALNKYGWGYRKECHSLWFNAGAELGFPGLAFLVAFYGLAIWGLAGYVKQQKNMPADELAGYARMVIVALAGFAVSASFVSLDNLEPPYYVVTLGAGVLIVAGLRFPSRGLPVTA